MLSSILYTHLSRQTGCCFKMSFPWSITWKILMTLTKLEKFVQKYKDKRAVYGRSLFAASECFKGLTYLLTTKAKNMYQNCLRQGSVLINVTSNLPRCLGLGTLTVHLLLFWFSWVYCFNQQHFKRAGIKELEILTRFPCLHFCHYVTFFLMTEVMRCLELWQSSTKSQDWVSFL